MVKYVSVDEFATWKNVSPRVVRAEIGKGRIPGAERIGNAYRIPIDEAEFRTKKYATIEDYHEWKGVSVRVVRAEIGRGNIRAERIGKEYRIPVDKIE